ncbi:MAG TPA: biosynthetic-type acetolactate synthase large subunit [Ramlibacter sp.]|nr:biosynthetic-type acetolactate synthase large subunit [Ramlibacter sp.]
MTDHSITRHLTDPAVDALPAPTPHINTVADHLVQCLVEEGVRHLFGYPGGAALPVYDAMARSGLVQHVLVRHEQSAAHAADGYARASGQVGVCLVSSGPGVTNALTGIATAYMDSIPMVVLTGQAPTHALGQDAFQEVDTIGITRSCVKHSFMLTDPDQVEATLKKAFHLARTGRPGPVLIDLPRDITAAPIRRAFRYPQEVGLRAYCAQWPLPAGALAEAVQAIASAQRPLIYYGGGVVLGNAADALRRLAAVTGAPVTSTLMGLGAFPGDSAQFLGMLGMHGLYEANLAMQHCDVLVAVGARFDDRVIGDPKDFARPRRRIIHIDVDPTSIDKRVAVDLPIVGDCAQVMNALCEGLQSSGHEPPSRAAWHEQIETWRAMRCLDYPQSVNDEIKPQSVIEQLSRLPGAEDFIVTSDVGQHQMWTAQHFRFRKPRRWINSGGLGTMGFGLPAAIGASMACPDRTVVCVTGDGSIQMSTKELSTCLQQKLPIKIICLNNRYLGMVRQQQDLYHGQRRSQSYMDALPDFVKLAQAYGHRGLRVERASQLPQALAEAIAARDQLVFLDIAVDRTENVYPTLASDQPLTKMILRPQVRAEDL